VSVFLLVDDGANNITPSLHHLSLPLQSVRFSANNTKDNISPSFPQGKPPATENKTPTALQHKAFAVTAFGTLIPLSIVLISGIPLGGVEDEEIRESEGGEGGTKKEKEVMAGVRRGEGGGGGGMEERGGCGGKEEEVVVEERRRRWWGRGDEICREIDPLTCPRPLARRRRRCSRR
jgi:hypothetical protein